METKEQIEQQIEKLQKKLKEIVYSKEFLNKLNKENSLTTN